jgi:hypothetical protein
MALQTTKCSRESDKEDATYDNVRGRRFKARNVSCEHASPTERRISSSTAWQLDRSRVVRLGPSLSTVVKQACKGMGRELRGVRDERGRD